MRKFLGACFPACLLTVFLGVFLSTCGGGGDGGGSSASLTSLSISGPATTSEYGTATYTATATWSDNSTSTVTPTWSTNSQMASISADGVLYCQGIDGDVTVTVSASYSAGGITETAEMDVAIANVTTKPFTPQMVSGAALFQESASGGGQYESLLLIFNADFTFEQYEYETPPENSFFKTGSWSIDASGKLLLEISGQPTVTVELVGDLGFGPADVVVDDGTGTPELVHLEICSPGPYPFESAKLPGTYVNQVGDTWIFKNDGTGSTTGDGGWTYTWSVDAGVLKVVFPNNYVGSMYMRQSTQVSPSSYPVIKWAFVIHTPTGGFGFYYGGMELTLQ